MKSRTPALVCAVVLYALGTASFGAPANSIEPPLFLRPNASHLDFNDHGNVWSPDGRQLLFTSRRDSVYKLYIVSLKTGDVTPALPNVSLPQLNGEWSPDGERIAFLSWPGDSFDEGELYLVNADGSSLTRLTDSKGPEGDRLSWSPDGGRIAFWSEREGNRDVYTIRPDGTGLTRITTHSAEDRDPDYSPDSERIAFVSFQDGGADGEIWVMDADGSNQRRLTTNDSYDGYPRWSRDGSQIGFFSDRERGWQVYVMHPDGTGQQPLTDSRGCNFGPDWSPDGSRIAFNACRDGRRGIYVMNADGSEERKLTNLGQSHFVTVALNDGPEHAVRRFTASREKNPDAVYFFESEARMLGLRLLDENRSADAIRILELNTKVYPQADIAWQALAEAFDKEGRPRPVSADEIVAGFREHGSDSTIKKILQARMEFPEWPLNYEAAVNVLGYQLLGSGETERAIEVFVANSALYPTSGNVWDSLAEAYLKAGEETQAQVFYQKSLRVDPSNDNAAEMLRQIRTRNGSQISSSRRTITRSPLVREDGSRG